MDMPPYSRSFLTAIVVFVGLLTCFELWFVHTHAGAFAPPIDDTYIHFTYARSLAEGRFFEFVPGEGYTRGATSFLYPLILALPLKLGLPDNAMVWFAAVLGGLFYGVSAIGIYCWIRRLAACENLARWSTAFYLLNGTLHWGIFSGMEIALFACLLSLTLATIPAEELKWKSGCFLAFSAALALVRPEGMLITSFICTGLIFHFMMNRRIKSALVCMMPPMAGSIKPLLDWIYTGSMIPAGMYAKGMFSEQMSGGRRADWIESLMGGMFGIRFRLQHLGDQFAGFFQGFVWVCVLIGLAVLGRYAKRNGLRYQAVLGCFAVFFVSIVLCFLLPVGDWQYNRYFLHLLVVYVPLMTIGILWIERKLNMRPFLAWGFLGLSILTIPYWSTKLATTSRSIHLHHHRIAEWLEEHVPRDSVLAINDAGFLPWKGGWKIIDLMGLVTPRFESPNTHIVWENIRDLPPEDRPDYFVVYPYWFPQLFDHGFLTSIHDVFLTGDLEPEVNHMAVCRADWSLADLCKTPHQAELEGYRMVDRLNICNRRDEEDHQYVKKAVLRRENIQDWTNLFEYGRTVLIDSGRFIRGTESFTMKAEPGRPLRIVSRFRTVDHDHYPIYLDVKVDHQDAGTWRLTPWVTLGRNFLEPGKEGTWMKNRGGDFYLANDILDAAATHMEVYVTVGSLPEATSQTLTILDRTNQVLYEDHLTSGEQKRCVFPLDAFRPTAPSGYQRLFLTSSHLHYPDLNTDPPEKPDHPTALMIKSFSVYNEDLESSRTLFRDMRKRQGETLTESIFNVSGEMVQGHQVGISLSTNSRWSESKHSSYHYWTYVHE
jgi:hypothetical protein